MSKKPIAAKLIPPPEVKSIYPPPFMHLMQGREKRKIGDYFNLTNFGINLTRLEPGAISALYHHHERQDEFVYILEGSPTLLLKKQEYTLNPGECMGFKAGKKMTSQLINRTAKNVIYLEIGDRTEGDSVEYPNDDLKADQNSGQWVFSHKDGQPY